MSHPPLARSGPPVELPANAGMEPLVGGLGPLRAQPVEVTVTVPDGKSRRCVMDLLVAEGDLVRALTVAADACRGVPGFELSARQFEG